jgi:uncharacterized protein
MASQAILSRLQAEFDSPPEAIAAAVALLADKAPPAFIARHRRWATGNMHEDRLQALADRLHFLEDLDARKVAISKQAEERGRMTDELRHTLATSVDQDLIDDLYQSMRPRRRTPAMQMEEKGLGALCLAIQHDQLGSLSLPEAAKEYVSEEKGLPTIEAVLEGVVLIFGERIGHDPATRARFRDELRSGVLTARATNPDQGGAQRYKDLFEFAEPIGRIGAGRMLALRRAEREGFLQLKLTLPGERHREILRELHLKTPPADAMLREFWDVVFDHVWQAVLQDACGKDVSRRMKEKADREAVRTYSRNLRSLLLSPPLGSKKVLALRTSSKTVWAALLGEDGSVLQHKTLTLNTDDEKKAAFDWLVQIVRDEKPAALALPHGRRQAGSEKVVDELRTALGETPLPMTIPVDEAASAIFATSPIGRKALPNIEVGVRTAISLGRRLQDPLQELLRMDVRTLGLGQTLDDVHQGMLARELGAVMSACLGSVGLDVNTADLDSLSQVPGLNEDLARAILDHRKKHGGFKNRAALAAVPGIDERTLRHVAGFLCIHGGDQPLDRTQVHPDDYPLVERIAAKKGVPAEQLLGNDLRDVDLDQFVEPGTDRFRVLGVVQALRNAGSDPRGQMTAANNEGVRSLDDLRPSLELRGRIANLTEFGAFVDLGIGQDGLVHISQIPGHRLRNPDQQLRVGEVVQVWVLNVDREQKKISLSMHQPRHLAENRQATVGERMDQQQRGGRPPRRREREEPKQVFSRAARKPESRRGNRRNPPLTLEGKPEEHRLPAASAGEGGEGGPPQGRGERRPGRFDRGDRGDRDRGPRRGGGESRVITVESEKAVAETKGKKGEITSLAGLRALLRKSDEAAKSDEAVRPSDQPT